MLVLASASPRRQELLRAAGIAFTVESADIDEAPLAGEMPRACAERLAKEKALTVWRRLPGDVVLGADTVVTVGGIILGKPADAADAARMLRMLSGRVHEVITGVCLVSMKKSPLLANPARDGVPQIKLGSETTLVTMTEISDREIRDYIATGEPMDKAGAYAIQGGAGRWIPQINGDYNNVVGLPVALVERMIAEMEGLEGNRPGKR
ncbi:MAG TPA: Maf family protein [Verrucomicrobiae bacterium]|jgi:septum formation protein|nr:Maf family protein [Verrucomicrobiae bacterium]